MKRAVSRSVNRSFGSTKLFVENPIPGVGDEGCRLPSPSRINTLPKIQQAFFFISTCGSLFLLSFLSLLIIERMNMMGIYNNNYIPVVIGFLYSLAGLSHFTMSESFCNIMPSNGAWGFWYLPGSKKFHVDWTGCVEIFGGLSLIIGSISSILGYQLHWIFGSLLSDVSFALLLLTILITPANIYMITHGAKLPIDGPEVSALLKSIPF